MVCVLDWCWTLVVVSILITRYAAIDITLEANNQSQIYNYTFSRSNRSTTDETDTLNITSPDAQLIQLVVNSSGNLSEEACAEGPIQMFTGPTRLLIGSYCGGEGKDYFSGSHPVLVIIVNTTSLPDDIEINFQYIDMDLEIDFFSAMTASWTPRYLYTSNYPDGGSLFDRRYINARAPEGLRKRSYRVLVTLKYADVDYTTNCSLSSVGLLTSYDTTSFKYYFTKDYRWCGNTTDTFAASHDTTIIISRGQKLLGSGLRIMLRTVKVPACGQSRFMDRSNDNVVIQSPAFPNSYPELQSCNWEVRSVDKLTAFRYYRIKLDVLDIDCQDDILEIMYPNRTGGIEQIRLECEAGPLEMEVYAVTIRFWFISSVQKNLNRTGFNMTVLRLNETSCFTELEATDTEQKLLPQVTVPRHGICKWVITATGSLNVVKIRITNWQSFSCEYRKNRIYNGLTENAQYMLNRECQDHGFYITTGSKMLIVISEMADIENSTQQIEFWQGQYSKNLTRSEGKFSYPFGGGKYKQGADVTWNIDASPGRRIDLIFRKMDVNCEGDSVNIHDGESVRDICGSRVRRILSQTNNVQINFKSTTDMGEGFQLEYGDLIEKDCTEGVIDVNANGCNMASPGVDHYYDHLLCKWRITVEKDKLIKLIINVTNIVSTSRIDCKGDYLQVYDGNSTTSPALPRVCGYDKEVTLGSSGNQMYVEFITDSVLAGTGFQAQCQTMTPVPGADPSTGLSSGAIAAIVLVPLIILALGCLLFLYLRRRRSKNMADITTSVNDDGTHMSSASPPYHHVEKTSDNSTTNSTTDLNL